jgi:hypothetical protein
MPRYSQFKELQIGDIFYIHGPNNLYVKVSHNTERNTLILEGSQIYKMYLSDFVVSTGQVHFPTIVRDRAKQLQDRPCAD